MPGEQGLELDNRFLMPPEAGIRPAQFPAGRTTVGLPPGRVSQIGDSALVVSAIAVGDFEIALRHLHPGVELEGAGKLRDRLVDQPLLVIKNAEVVVRPGVGGIDPLGERAENRKIALRQRRGWHDRYGIRMASKMARREATSGSRRK